MGEKPIQKYPSCGNLQVGQYIVPIEGEVQDFIKQQNQSSNAEKSAAAKARQKQPSPMFDTLRICAAGPEQKKIHPNTDHYVLREDRSTAYQSLVDCPAGTKPSTVLMRTDSVRVKKADAEKPEVIQYETKISLDALSLQLFYNEGAFSEPSLAEKLGSNPLQNPKHICRITDGEAAGQVHVSSPMGEHVLDQVDPMNQPIEAPASYPGFKDLEPLAAQEAIKGASSIPVETNDKMAFWAHYHSLQDLHAEDVAILLQLLGEDEKKYGQRPWLLPLEDLRSDKRRNYAISVTAVHYYGAYLIEELRHMADGVYGKVSETTHKRCHDLATRLEILLAEQSKNNSGKVAEPIPLDLKVVGPALAEVFEDPHVLDKIKEIDLKNQANVWAQPMANYGPKDMPWYVFRNDYIGWEGAIHDSEIRLLYAIESWKSGLTNQPAYTWFDLGGMPPGTSSDDHFICETPDTIKEAGDKTARGEEAKIQNQATGRLCNRRRYEAWQGEIATLKKLHERTQHPAMKIRLQEIIKVDEALEKMILDDSNANSFKHSWWAALAFVGLSVIAARKQKIMMVPMEDVKVKNTGAKAGAEGEGSKPGSSEGEGDGKGKGAEYSRLGRFRWDLLPHLTAQQAQWLGLAALTGGGIWAATKYGSKAALKKVPVIGTVYTLADPSIAFASEAETLKRSPQEGDWVIDDKFCVREYVADERGYMLKQPTKICGSDPVKQYAQERGDEQGVAFVEHTEAEFEQWLTDVVDGIEIEFVEPAP